MSKLAVDRFGYKIQAFSFIGAVQSTSAYTPTSDVLVHLGGDCTITLNGVGVPFTSGDKIVLVGGILYTFDVDTPLGLS